MYNNMMNGGMWVWPVLGILAAVLIVVVVIKLVKKMIRSAGRKLQIAGFKAAICAECYFFAAISEKRF